MLVLMGFIYSENSCSAHVCSFVSIMNVLDNIYSAKPLEFITSYNVMS